MTASHPPTPLDDQPMSVRAKLVAAWTSFMFISAYIDILNFYTPGVVRGILDGRVFEFALSQTFSATSLSLMAVPSLMAVLSAALPARAARMTNLVVVALYTPVMAFNLMGESWLLFYGLGLGLELVLFGFIVRSAWTWPRKGSSAVVAGRDAVPAGIGTP